ncbi:MAG: cell wall-active antibiotics response protein [Tannerella sp.]|jgi:predicted membrane protein|nr:cell wall-active antibiotics response protein [Tannerella sp.]
METKNYYRNHLRNKLIFGGLVIAVGIVLFGLNFGFIPKVWKPIIFSWQMLIILWGIIELFYAKFFKGIALLLVGGFFLIPHFYRAFPECFGWASENFVQIYWPLLLVAGGVILIVYWLLPEKYKKRYHWFYCHDGRYHFKASKSKKYEKKNGALEKDIIFAGSDQILLDEVFNGGEINIVFGGLNLDLRRTTLSEGETHLELNVVFGGIKLYVPNDWFVEISTDNVAGGFADNRFADRENMDKSRKLIIGGSLVFSGIELNN